MGEERCIRSLSAFENTVFGVGAGVIVAVINYCVSCTPAYNWSCVCRAVSLLPLLLSDLTPLVALLSVIAAATLPWIPSPFSMFLFPLVCLTGKLLEFRLRHKCVGAGKVRDMDEVKHVPRNALLDFVSCFIPR